jgi:CRP-like cAMP-binding protein
MTPVAAVKQRRKFDLKTFLSTIDEGRTIATFTKKQRVFDQGDLADAVFYIQRGKVRLSVVSKSGKEATIRHSERGSFLRRRLPRSTASSDVHRDRYDRLHADAGR